ncbi:LuxR family transcriptional regulator [Mycobacterium barrassiae]|uniref:LuxR C-terminal-related transcriptional regulator n=1 Tax=Mycobacterium barrassiae TaxID=319709 RepID=UPI0022659095|nr:LuxR C-terminal-related transcriptional regulator [Mycobacterium barrassiae]MCV7301289.1 LuxR family transcriptional regulator [Mycobacterium barrassiae]
MTTQMTVVPNTPASTAVERAYHVVAAVNEQLGLPPSEVQMAALACTLDELSRRLEQRIALAEEPADDLAATAELLISVLKVRCDLLDEDLTRRMRCMSEIRRALAGLQGLSPREMIYAAPLVLSREFGFARTMISTVRGSVWRPQHLYIDDKKVDSYSRPFLDWVHGAHIQLADAPLETELIRKRCGALVSSPKEDKRTFKEIVDVSGCRGYVAAPITLQGRAIGMLHADRPDHEAAVTTDHLDQLEAFAECLAVAFESAALEEKAAQQRTEVDNLRSEVDELLRRPTRSAVWPVPGQRHDDHDRHDRPAVPSLTAREREIMSYVATGATNAQIARCLVISEGTVKSHLKHIARKLHTPSRAAAVAVYAGIAAVDAGATP